MLVLLESNGICSGDGLYCLVLLTPCILETTDTTSVVKGTDGTLTVTSAKFLFPALSVTCTKILWGPGLVMFNGIDHFDQFPGDDGVAGL